MSHGSGRKSEEVSVLFNDGHHVFCAYFKASFALAHELVFFEFFIWLVPPINA